MTLACPPDSNLWPKIHGVEAAVCRDMSALVCVHACSRSCLCLVSCVCVCVLVRAHPCLDVCFACLCVCVHLNAEMTSCSPVL